MRLWCTCNYSFPASTARKINREPVISRIPRISSRPNLAANDINPTAMSFWRAPTGIAATTMPLTALMAPPDRGR
jgi:hypothetical protein